MYHRRLVWAWLAMSKGPRDASTVQHNNQFTSRRKPSINQYQRDLFIV
jgi:hypothetical protein